MGEGELLVETSEGECPAVRDAAPRRWQRATIAALACMGVAAAVWSTSSSGTQLAEMHKGAATEELFNMISGQARKGSFIVLGDWGYDAQSHGNLASAQCQKSIAARMLQTFTELGDVKFIVNVGDSFYPGGVSDKNDPQWQAKWRNVYAPELRSVPWYSVYGNHDYHKDPCACTTDVSKCAQVNTDINNKEFFYMPAPYWYLEHPELDMEVIALDTNEYMWAWDKNPAAASKGFQDCEWTPCKETCFGIAANRAQASFNLFYDRMKKSTAKNLLVFSHYPTDYFWSVPAFIDGLSASRSITYYGGHRHNVDNTSTLKTGQNPNWLAGGGGGWSCEGLSYSNPPAQGFVVGEIASNFTITTYSVLVNYSLCCGV
uniref:Calcineurin-like phosphoesterase domain-containing protein n=1 Tax=Strombidinopsis acuminata TaxID=141414 RepID=A0A7S3SG18_9SPIT